MNRRRSILSQARPDPRSPRRGQRRRRRTWGFPGLERLETRTLLSEVTLDWTTQFTGLYNGQPTAMDSAQAVTSSGDVYVVGTTSGALSSDPNAGSGDVFVRKYDADNNLVWTRQFGSSADLAYEAAADSSGVYVVGMTSGTISGATRANDFGRNAFLRKYDADGSVAWTRQFGSPNANDHAYAYGTAVDATGVYVVGKTAGSLPGGPANQGGDDAFLRKYDLDGNILWTQQYGTGGFDSLQAVAVRDSDVYVTGITNGNTSSMDAIVRRYDSAGNFLGHLNIVSAGSEQANAVAVDATGVYVGGATTGSLVPNQANAGQYDAFVRKFNLDLTSLVWTRQFGFAGDDQIAGLGTSATGVYAGGYTSGTLSGQTSAGSRDAFVRKFGVDGSTAWTKQFGSAATDLVNGLAIDGTKIYVAGKTYGSWPGETLGGYTDAFAAKLSEPRVPVVQFTAGSRTVAESAGTLTIEVEADIAPESDLTVPVSVLSDGTAGANDFELAAGSVIIPAGQTTGSIALTIADDAIEESTEQFTLALGSPADAVLGVTSRQTITLNDDDPAPTVSYAASVDLGWTDQFGAGDSSFNSADAVAVGADGSLYVGGSTTLGLPGQAHLGNNDAFVRRYDGEGNITWTEQFGTSGYDYVGGLASHASGLYVVGWTTGALPGQMSDGSFDAFVRKYDSEGNIVWTRQFGSVDRPSHDEARGVAVDDTGVYVVGKADGKLSGAPEPGAYLRKYDHDGNEIWTRFFVGDSSSEAADAVALDASGVYVVGDAYGSMPGQVGAGRRDAFVRKYDRDGAELWTRQFGTPGDDRAGAVTTSAGQVYVVGVQDQDAFVRRYDAEGNLGWSSAFGSPDDDQAEGVAVYASGLYVVGWTTGVLPGQVTAGGWDAFMRKYDTEGRVVWTRQLGGEPSWALPGDRFQDVAAGPSGVFVSGATKGTFPGQTDSGYEDALVSRLVEGGPTVNLTASRQTVGEPDGVVTVTASLAEALTVDVLVPLAITPGTAGSADFETTDTRIVIPAGQTSGSVDIGIVDDPEVEDDEQFSVTMGNPTNASQGTVIEQVVTIISEDVPIHVSFDTAEQVAGEGAGTITVGASLDVIAPRDIVVPLDFSGTADAGDYTRSATLIVIPAGQTAGSVTLTLTDDVFDEPDESITLTLNVPAGVGPGTTTEHVVTITDNDPTPSVRFVQTYFSYNGFGSWSSPSRDVTEGDGVLFITAELSAASSYEVAVPVTIAGTAVEGEDYRLPNGTTIVFQPGSRYGNLRLDLIDDITPEEVETIVLTMQSPTHAILSSNPYDHTQHTVRIAANNAPLVSLYADGWVRSLEEGASMTLMASLNFAIDRDVTVPVRVTAGAEDVTLSAEQIVIPAGSTQGSITATAIDDDLIERDPEYAMFVLGDPENAFPHPYYSSYSVSIPPSDIPVPVVTMALDRTTVREFDSNIGIQATVSLSAPQQTDVVVPLVITGGTATYGEDYFLAPDLTLTVPAGQITASKVILSTHNDFLDEPDETIVVEVGLLEGAVRGPIDQTREVVTIRDDNATVNFTTTSPAAFEEGRGPVAVDVQLTRPKAFDTWIPFRVYGSATFGSEYDVVEYDGPDGGVSRKYSGLNLYDLVIPAGRTSGQIRLNLADDDLTEADESVFLELIDRPLDDPNRLYRPVIGPASLRRVVIRDNDFPTVNFDTAGSTVREGQASLPVTVTLTAPIPDKDVTVSVAIDTAHTTAQSGSEYQVSATSVTIPRGQTTGSFSINTFDDTNPYEVTEQVVLYLRSPANAVLGTSKTYILSIENDDPMPASTGTSTGSDSSSGGTSGSPSSYQPPSPIDTSVPVTSAGDGGSCPRPSQSWGASQPVGGLTPSQRYRPL